ncbi:hypothetical protein [Bdellovibrio bacteriovorus]|uniref:hypothetical protein n=1 Tax=Bdellovibrio bacteriovorus TaxID=959 RepID=UPI0035A68A96
MTLKPLIGVIVTLMIGASAFAAPQETKQTTLTRTAQSANTVRGELSANVYKQEPYQANYTEQVPYQAEETYYVDVPYQAEETYTVDIPYQTTETYYENVPYTERVAYTDYEEYWDTEYQCRNVTKYRQECSNERLCEPGGRTCQPITECGTNAHGERICKTRNECTEGPRVCRDVPSCRQVPYTDRECSNERVRKTRPVTRYRDETHYRQELRTRTVTKYRQETRTRTVTKYRSEARTRTVTKYREETRCCVTKYREVFDHQFTQPVSVIFPQEAALLAGESEQIKLVLSGTEAKPEVQMTIQSDIFTYVVAESKQEGREKVFVVKTTPKWNEANAGTATVTDLKLQFNKGQGQITFKETIGSARVTSVYTVVIRDQQSQAVVFEQRAENTAAKIVTIATPGLAREGQYSIQLRVERHGVNVASGALSFEQTALYEKKELDQDEVQNLKNASQVQILRIEGAGADRVVIIRDQTPAMEEVQSQYKLVVWKKLSNGKIEWLGEKNFTREAIALAGEELGIALKAINLNPSPSTKLYMDLVVRRDSAQYLGGQKVQFIVNKTF